MRAFRMAINAIHKELAHMKKLLAILVAGLFASGAFAQSAPATPAVTATPEAAPSAPVEAKAKNHHAKAAAQHKGAKKSRKSRKTAA